MKIKSLLLGSAAALALSSGAYAADPAMAEFVSLDVCDAYGISGLTIASDDTCLLITGEVSYEFEVEGVAGNDLDENDYSSIIDWSLTFDASTQTDAGRAQAVITLFNDEDEEDVMFDEAYVAFGDTTVLMAGKKGTIFEVTDNSHIALVDERLDRFNGWFDQAEEIDDYIFPERGGHVIQVVSEVADGFSVKVGLEDLDNADSGGGTLGAGVGYAGAGVAGNVGVLFGDIFGDQDEWSVYGDVTADLGVAEIFASSVYSDTEWGYSSWAALLTASAEFDLFSVRAGVGYESEEYPILGNYSPEVFSVGAGVGFALTDTADLDVEVRYFDGDVTTRHGRSADSELDAELGVAVALTEALTASAFVGGNWDDTGADDVYRFGAGLAYAPGGNFETSLDAEVNTLEEYSLTFAASKSF
ncbi:porin [Pelagibacterium montanilacus]|uniref:porin n=1 Tax=Pelagibacterium montanilacus TaxID=2185280 RepID=UPI000F8F532D|nr:porin [Pelagibacterium montanilacus]